MSDREQSSFTPPKKTNPWITLCLVLAAASVFYRLLILNHYEQTSLLYIGIPLFLAIGLSMTPRPKSATGIIMKGITLALLLIGVLLIEGFICILIASPLFYLIGSIIGLIMDCKAKRNNLKCSVIGVLVLMSFEGVTDWLSFDRSETVIVTKSVNFSQAEARNLLASGPRFDLNELPLFLQLGFALPASIDGDGVELGDEWTIHFAGGETKSEGLTVKVTTSTEDSIALEFTQDSSYISNWMNCKSAEWQITKVNDHTSNIKMTLEYDRLLDPAWYFKPIQRYGARKAAEFFISQTFKKG